MSPAAALLLLAFGSQVDTEGRPRIHLEVDPCIPVSSEEVRRILAIELKAALDDAPDPSANTTRIRLSCRDDLATLRVDDPITRKSLDRSIDLGSRSPKARPRLLALAAAELVTASWTELESNPEPKVPPAGPPPSPEARQAVSATLDERTTASVEHTWMLAAEVGARAAPGGPTYGGGLLVHYDGWSWGGFTFDALSHYGTFASALGTIAETNVSGGLSIDARRRAPRYTFRGGLGVRGGPVWLAGLPYQATADGSVLFGWWTGGFMRLGLEVPLGRSFSLEASAEAGLVIKPVTALVDGQPAVSVDGAWGALNLGAGWDI